MRRALLTVIVLCLWPLIAAAGALDPDAARARAQEGELVIVDVRLPQEWAKTGLPEGAKGVPLQNPETFDVRPGFVEDVLRAVGGDKDQPIGVICARGNRSVFAQGLLERAGFSDVHDISEGVMGGPNGPGWLARGLPTEACEVC